MWQMQKTGSFYFHTEPIESQKQIDESESLEPLVFFPCDDSNLVFVKTYTFNATNYAQVDDGKVPVSWAYGDAIFCLEHPYVVYAQVESNRSVEELHCYSS